MIFNDRTNSRCERRRPIVLRRGCDVDGKYRGRITRKIGQSRFIETTATADAGSVHYRVGKDVETPLLPEGEETTKPK